MPVKAIFAMFAAFLLFSLSAAGQEIGSDPAKLAQEGTNIYTASIAALTKLFVLAVLVESALSLIFNWRIFMEYFNRRAIKTIVMLVVSLLVVKTFNIDIVAQLMTAYGQKSPEGGLMTSILTAMILAGGSSGVNNLFIALGFRSPMIEQAPQPPKTEAWISILVQRDSAVTGEVLVQISEDTSGSVARHDSIAGSVNARKKIRDLLFPNRNRFPVNGGYKVESSKVYRISVTGKDESGVEYTGLGETYSFAPRAIVDLDVKL